MGTPCDHSDNGNAATWWSWVDVRLMLWKSFIIL